MRPLWLVVCLVAGCAGTAPGAFEQRVAWSGDAPLLAAPRDSIEQERTGQALNRSAASLPRTADPR